MKTLGLLLFNLLVIQNSTACTCAPASDAEFYYQYPFIQTAVVRKIDKINKSTWLIELAEVALLKGELKSSKVITNFQNSSCSIDISEGDTWVFFFSSLDTNGRIELTYCNPSRNQKRNPFDLESLFQYAYFDHKTIPDSIFAPYLSRIDSLLEAHFKNLGSDSLSDTSVLIHLNISNTGRLDTVIIGKAILLSAYGSPSQFEHFPIEHNYKIDRFIKTLEVQDWPILYCYSRDLNMRIYWLYPRKPEP